MAPDAPAPPEAPERAATRERILEAACDLIAVEGIDDVRIARVANRARVSTALVHHYFSTREDLLEQAILHSFQLAADERFDEEPIDDESATDGLARAIRTSLPERGGVGAGVDPLGGAVAAGSARSGAPARGGRALRPLSSVASGRDPGGDQAASSPPWTRAKLQTTRWHCSTDSDCAPCCTTPAWTSCGPGVGLPSCSPPALRIEPEAAIPLRMTSTTSPAARSSRAGGGAALAAYGLSGCTVSRPIDTADAGEIVKPKIDGDLLIYNWAQYMDPALKKEFAERYDVEVNEVNFDNLEAMVVKLRAGGQYDLIWPSTEYVARLAAEGLLRRFDRDDLRNSKNISPFYDSPWWDPQSEYSVPYAYYTTGIAWRDDEVTGMTGSWNDLLNPDGAGRMFILDDFQEAIGEANLINGLELNTEDDERARGLEGDAPGPEGERSRASPRTPSRTWSAGPRSYTRRGTATSSTSATRSTTRSSTGTRPATRAFPVGSDLMCIPATARSPGTAMMFMDWMIEPEHAARNVQWNGYPQPVEGGLQAFAELVKEEPSIDVNLEELGEQRARVPARQSRGASALDPGLHRGQGIVRRSP